MAFTNQLYPLEGVVQHYAWGGYHFIPELLAVSNADRQPFAEYWLGAHPNHPARLHNGQEHSLADVIRNEPHFLGTDVAKKFASLPYLLKVLDVRQMLSIQVHPSKEAARAAYIVENEKGIPLTAGHRNYKDENHKPELMAALGDFWLLHGFKGETELAAVLDQVPELRFLASTFRTGGYRGLYEAVMLMEQAKVNDILKPLADRIVPLYQEGRLEKSSEDFWAARAILTFCKGDRFDRGIFSVYFFNLLHLKKGEGIFQPAGMPHAYLEGQNVEVMANSDNVLRAGLTDKHIDVPELLAHVRFEPTTPDIIRPVSGAHHQVYQTPAEEFELHRYQLTPGREELITTQTAEIWLLLEGEVRGLANGEAISWKKGEAVLAKAGVSVQVHCLRAAALYRVTVPGPSKI
jgi:mannose-6-phosphate isomerase